MMKTYYIAIVALLIGLQVPALAIWNIPSESKAPKQLDLPVMREKSDFTAEMPRSQRPDHASVTIIDRPDAAVVKENRHWTERPRTTTIVRNDYMKTPEEVKVMNPVLFVNGVPTNVPEPGSLLGLSTGIAGLFFQIRRMRKRA